MVLYRMRGWTDIMRGSMVFDMLAVVSGQMSLVKVVVEFNFSWVLRFLDFAVVVDLGCLVGWSLGTASWLADWPWRSALHSAGAGASTLLPERSRDT